MKGQIWTIGLVAMLASVIGAVMTVALMGPTPLHAETASSSNDVVIVTGNTRSQSHDVLYLIDTKSNRLLAYEFRGRALTLAAARYIEFDLQLDEWPAKSQQPGVKKVRKVTKDENDAPTAGTRKLIAATGNFLSDTRDLLYVYDTKSQRLVIYEYNNSRLNIIAARTTRFDLKLHEWPQGGQKPSVKAVEKMVKNP
ncbi:MAG: hypothetical protein O7H41_10910 [Planctomycetota bacterium]|nr:hypothetical protein [Planctomycetota bacterium]